MSTDVLFTLGGQTANDFGGKGKGKNYGKAFHAYECTIVKIANEQTKGGSSIVKVYLSSDEVEVGDYDQLAFFPDSEYFINKIGKFLYHAAKSNGVSDDKIATIKEFKGSMWVGKQIGIIWKPQYNNPKFCAPSATCSVEDIETINTDTETVTKYEAWHKEHWEEEAPIAETPKENPVDAPEDDLFA